MAPSGIKIVADVDWVVLISRWNTQDVTRAGYHPIYAMLMEIRSDCR